MKGLWSLAVVALVAAAPSTASAQFFTENFDAYTTGSLIAGQGGWETWDNVAAVNTTVVSTQAFTTPNSLLITGQADIVRRFTGVTSGTWYAKTRVFVPSTQVGESWFIVLNRYAPLAADNNWSIQLVMCVTGCTTQGAIAGTAASLGGTGIPGSGSVPLVTNQWVEVRAEINLTANSYNLFYNNTLVQTGLYQATGLQAVSAIDLFSNGSTDTFMDDVWLDTTVPVELTTFAVE